MKEKYAMSGLPHRVRVRVRVRVTVRIRVGVKARVREVGHVRPAPRPVDREEAKAGHLKG